MNKNTIIGTLLIVGIMIFWMSSNQKAAQAMEAQKQAEAAAAQVVDAPDASGLLVPDAEPKDESAPVLGDASAAANANAAAAAEAAKDTAANAANAANAAAATDSTAGAVAPAPVAPRQVVVETDKFIMTLSNKGAKVVSLVAKALPDSANNFPELIQDTSLGILDLKIDNADLASALFDAGDAPEKIKVENDTEVKFVYSSNGLQVIRSYAFTKEGNSVRQTNKFVGFHPRAYELAWKGGMRETEYIPQGKSFGGASYFFSEVVYKGSEGVEREMVRENKVFNEEKSSLYWAGLRRKYIAMTMQFDEVSTATLNTSFMKVPGNDKDPGTYTLALSDKISPAADSLSYNFMVLPLEWDNLKAMENDYEKIIVSGWSWCGADVWFVALCGLLLSLLKIFFAMIPNYGVAIILLTILVRLITTPFTVKQLRSTREMAKLKPELDAINVKYRSDPQKKQAAIMELYATHKINPLSSCTSGCLPMLIQMPVFIGLFIVLGRAIELRGMPAFLWISDLSRSDVIWNGIHIPFIMPDGLALLPLIMVVTTYFQTKVTMQGGMDPAQQKMMVWMMPAMMFLFSAVMPSGLVLYWIVSNLWSIVQYKVINKDRFKDTKTTVKGKKVQDAEIVK